MRYEQKKLKLTSLQLNTGQIEGIPKNPRIIKDDLFNKLKKSIQDNPEMLELREILVVQHPTKNDKYVVIAGNMRYKALKDLEIEYAPCKIIYDYSINQIKKFIITDNNSFGDWLFDFSKDDWNIQDLIDWGIEDFKIVDSPKKVDDATAPQEESEENKTSEMDDFYLAVYNNYIYAFRDTYVVSPNSINDPEYRCILNAQENKKNASKSNKKATDFTL